MKFEVSLSEDALQDLYDIGVYIAKRDGLVKAESVLVRMENVWEELESSPERGSHPNELLAFGVREYRQVFFKPYRIVYEVTGKRVLVVLIADGRRDMRVLLQQRLLQG